MSNILEVLDNIRALKAKCDACPNPYECNMQGVELPSHLHYGEESIGAALMEAEKAFDDYILELVSKRLFNK